MAAGPRDPTVNSVARTVNESQRRLWSRPAGACVAVVPGRNSSSGRRAPSASVVWLARWTVMSLAAAGATSVAAPSHGVMTMSSSQASSWNSGSKRRSTEMKPARSKRSTTGPPPRTAIS